MNNHLYRQTVTVCLLQLWTCTAFAGTIWNWNSGTTEGWVGFEGDTQLSIEPGRNGTFGLGAVNGPPYTIALFPMLEISGQTIDPGPLVGNAFGEYLPMTSDIYVDINRPIEGSHGNYLDLWIFGENSVARFHTYPYDGFGAIEDLGDGWYRHHLANRFRDGQIEYWPLPPGTIVLGWNFNFDASAVPVVFDNLTINAGQSNVPERNSTWLLLLASLGVAFMWRHSQEQCPAR